MDNTEVITAFLNGFGQWKGCCWPTEYGPGKLNLEGVKSSQAALMLGATSGSERAEWRSATDWLRHVEEDAHRAEEEAQLATNLAVLGDLINARLHAEEACHIEAQYASDKTWRPLLVAITKQMESAGFSPDLNQTSTPVNRSTACDTGQKRSGLHAGGGNLVIVGES